MLEFKKVSKPVRKHGNIPLEAAVIKVMYLGCLNVHCKIITYVLAPLIFY